MLHREQGDCAFRPVDGDSGRGSVSGTSALLTVVHALSDVTISLTGKLPAGLTIISAYASGFAL